MKNLTEQLKDGTLPEEYYYVKDPESGHEHITFFDKDEGLFYDCGDEVGHSSYNILAPVPTFEEWQEILVLQKLLLTLREPSIL